MKKITLLMVCMGLVFYSFAQTADEVVNKFLAASGGKEKLEAIKTLQYKQVIKAKSPMGDFEIPLVHYKDNNKLYRMQASMQFGGKPINFFALVNPTEGYIMVPENNIMGAEAGLKKMKDKEHDLSTYQMDAAGLFAGLVNYAAKGNKIELMKDAKVNKEDCYKIKFTNNMGQEVYYFISKATNLIVRMDAKGSMAASMSGMNAIMSSMGVNDKVDRFEVSGIYSGYTTIDGILFPSKMVFSGPMGEVESQFTDIKVNKAIDPKLYKAS